MCRDQTRLQGGGEAIQFRRAREDAHGPAHRTFAEQSALRALEHLHAFDVVDAHIRVPGHGHPGERYVVEVIPVVVAAKGTGDAADLHLREGCAVVDRGHAGHQRQGVDDVVQAQRIDVRSLQHRDGQGHIDPALVPAARRHDHFRQFCRRGRGNGAFDGRHRVVRCFGSRDGHHAIRAEHVGVAGACQKAGQRRVQRHDAADLSAAPGAIQVAGRHQLHVGLLRQRQQGFIQRLRRDAERDADSALFHRPCVTWVDANQECRQGTGGSEPAEAQARTRSAGTRGTNA
jgi:hypothetical protein